MSSRGRRQSRDRRSSSSNNNKNSAAKTCSLLQAAPLLLGVVHRGKQCLGSRDPERCKGTGACFEHSPATEGTSKETTEGTADTDRMTLHDPALPLPCLHARTHARTHARALATGTHSGSEVVTPRCQSKRKPSESSCARICAMFCVVHAAGDTLRSMAAFSAGSPKESQPIGWSTSKPRMRCTRAMQSLRVYTRTWPRWSAPEGYGNIDST